MDKKIIGFDLDGVFLDFSELKQRIAKERGFAVALHETPAEIYETLIPHDILEDIKKHIYYFEGAHALSVPLMPGARESLERVHKSGIPYALVSRRRSGETAIAVLERHGLWPAYFNETNAFFVKTREDKDLVAQKLGVTHFIDDEQKVLDAIPSVPNRILFDFLGAFLDTARYPRVGSWDELMEQILSR